MSDFKFRGVPEHVIHELMINTSLHLDYAARRLETLTSGKKIAEREVLKLRETERVLHRFNIAALETLRRDIRDATLVPAEAFIAGSSSTISKAIPMRPRTCGQRSDILLSALGTYNRRRGGARSVVSRMSCARWPRTINRTTKKSPIFLGRSSSSLTPRKYAVA